MYSWGGGAATPASLEMAWQQSVTKVNHFYNGRSKVLIVLLSACEPERSEDEVMTIEVAIATAWSPSLQTVGLVVAVTTALFVVVQAVAVVVQAWYIRGGLNQMRRASEERSRQLDQQAADSKAHFERQAADSERRHREMMQSLADQRRALETLIERTAAPSSPSPPLVVLG